jgi:MFS family permease
MLGFGIGEDYPASAVLMSEHANRSHRGRMISRVFSMPAPGPIVALALPAGGVLHDVASQFLLDL